MVISGEQFIALGRILLIIPNKFGWQELFRAGVQSMYLYLHRYLILIQANQLFRCEASPNDLDGNFNETRRRRHERTDFIIKCFDPGIVWEKYGIRSDVVVSLSVRHFWSQTNCAFSHLPMDFHVLISMSFYHLISFINSSKAHLRTTW